MAAVLAPGDRVLVLGGAGFIGSHLPRTLADIGVEFDTFDLFPHQPVPGAPRPRRHTIGDVRDLEALSTAMAGCTAVLNLAAAHHDFGISPATFEGVNVGGARNVVAAMRRNRVHNLCFYSSVAVYGQANAADGGPPTEETTPAPVNDYGRTKLAAEAVYRGWERQERDAGHDPRALVIRPAVVFGSRNFANVYRLIQQIDSRRFVPVGPGTNRKGMAYVGNLVSAIRYLWTRPPSETLGGAPEVYNYSDAPDLSSRAVISTVYGALGRRQPGVRVPLGPAVLAAQPFDLVSRVTGRNLPVTSARIRKLSEAETVFSSDRVRAAGHIPEVSLTSGLVRMVQWYVDEGRDAEPVVHLPPEWP